MAVGNNRGGHLGIPNSSFQRLHFCSWMSYTVIYRSVVIRRFSTCCVCMIFQRDCRALDGHFAGSTQSKQWRIELLYCYKRAKTSKRTALRHPGTVSLLCLLHYFKLYVTMIRRMQHLKIRLLKQRVYQPSKTR